MKHMSKIVLVSMLMGTTGMLMAQTSATTGDGSASTGISGQPIGGANGDGPGARNPVDGNSPRVPDSHNTEANKVPGPGDQSSVSGTAATDQNGTSYNQTSTNVQTGAPVQSSSTTTTTTSGQ
jgi:hypothetical protein